MPSVRTLTVSKDALKKLSNAAIDFDVRPHELVDAIVLNTNWERQVEKLAEIIHEIRRGAAGLSADKKTDSEPDSSERRTIDGLSRTPSRTLADSSRTLDNAENPEKRSAKVRSGLSVDSGGEKT